MRGLVLEKGEGLNGSVELRGSVLECASPLALSIDLVKCESARGLAHSKTWRRAGRLISYLYAFALIALCVVVTSGCATQNVQTRKQERYAVYAQLSPEFQSLADQGKIKVGMPKDAVYIAWGKPSEVVQGETPEGPIESWLYYGTTWDEYRYWNYRPYISGRYYYSEPYLDRDYVPRKYVHAQVDFQNGVVKSWRTLPRPAP